MTLWVRAALTAASAILPVSPNLAGAINRAEDTCEESATQSEMLNCYLDAANTSRAEMEGAFEQNLTDSGSFGQAV